jgi:hypothetical protein
MPAINWLFPPTGNPWFSDGLQRLKQIFTDLETAGAAYGPTDGDYVTGQVIKATFDHAVHGDVPLGAPGAVVEFGPVIPTGAVILGGVLYFETSLTSGATNDAAVVEIGHNTDPDGLYDPAAAISAAADYDAGIRPMIPDFQTAASEMDASALGDRFTIRVAGGGEAVDGGKFTILAHYHVPS